MKLNFAKMKKIKLYITINIAMAVFGLTLCIATAVLFGNGFPMEILILSGLLGASLAGMGISLTVDMLQIQSQFKKLSPRS